MVTETELNRARPLAPTPTAPASAPTGRPRWSPRPAPIHARSCTRKRADVPTAALLAAHSIQRAQRPGALRFGDGYHLRGESYPAHAVGGDLFDWIVRPDRRVAIIVADVCGHDLAAALIASACHAYFRAAALNAPNLATLVGLMAASLRDELTHGRFVTAVFAIVEPSIGAVHMYSAGHGYVFLREPDGAPGRRFEPDGPPLGVDDCDASAATTVRLGIGQSLVITTDGWGEPDTVNVAGDPMLSAAPTGRFPDDRTRVALSRSAGR